MEQRKLVRVGWDEVSPSRVVQLVVGVAIVVEAEYETIELGNLGLAPMELDWFDG